MPKGVTEAGSRFSATALWEELQESGMSATELAEEVGCTADTVAFWIAGLARPRLVTIRAMARALGIKAEDLMNEEDEEQ